MAYSPLVPNSAIYGLVARLTSGPNTAGLRPLLARSVGDYFVWNCLPALYLDGSFVLFATLVAISRACQAGLLPIELPGDKGLSSFREW